MVRRQIASRIVVVGGLVCANVSVNKGEDVVKDKCVLAVNKGEDVVKDKCVLAVA
jgi:hypothetical protein